MVFKEIVFGTAEYRVACSLRSSVLREPLGLSFTSEELAKEQDQLHFGLFEPEDNLIACVVAVKLSATDARDPPDGRVSQSSAERSGEEAHEGAGGTSSVTRLYESRVAREGVGRGVLREAGIRCRWR